MNKRELSHSIRKLVNEIAETHTQGWHLLIDINESNDLSNVKEILSNLKKNLRNVLDNLAIVEKECRIRYNVAKRKKENP